MGETVTMAAQMTRRRDMQLMASRMAGMTFHATAGNYMDSVTRMKLVTVVLLAMALIAILTCKLIATSMATNSVRARDGWNHVILWKNLSATLPCTRNVWDPLLTINLWLPLSLFVAE